MSAVAKPASTDPKSTNIAPAVVPDDGLDARRARPGNDENCIENKWVESTQRYVRTQNISEYLNHLTEIFKLNYSK